MIDKFGLIGILLHTWSRTAQRREGSQETARNPGFGRYPSYIYFFLRKKHIFHSRLWRRFNFPKQSSWSPSCIIARKELINDITWRQLHPYCFSNLPGRKSSILSSKPTSSSVQLWGSTSCRSECSVELSNWEFLQSIRDVYQEICCKEASES